MGSAVLGISPHRDGSQDNMQVTKNTSKTILDAVTRDLEPSTPRVLAHLAVAFGIGGIVSMFFCGQFGVGFSSFAIDFNHSMHSKAGTLLCALLCGGIFALAPVLVLRLTTHPLLFRAIVRRYSFIEGGITLAAGMLAYSHGNFKVEMINVAIWTISAYCVFKIIGLCVDHFFRGWTMDTLWSPT